MSSRPPEILVQGKRFRVERREVPRSDGGSELREVIVHPGSVILLPLLSDDRLLLIRNRRFTLNRTLWELPAGTLEPGERPEVCAPRELEEETGHRAGVLEHLFDFYPAPGVSDERMYAFVARDLVRTAQHLDPTEQIEVHERSLQEVLRMIREREIEDAKTIATVLYWYTNARSGYKTPA
ncbi:MAG: NUDIX hydrolase [Myxococcales bacterium]